MSPTYREADVYDPVAYEPDADLFCDTCGNFIEDCDCEVQ